MANARYHARRDLERYPIDARHVAAAVALQIHGNHDPESSRMLADLVIFAVDRAGARGKADALPDDAEVTRAQNALARRGVSIEAWLIREALTEAFAMRAWP